ncbi:uncharacterized protein LOC135845282 isoform X2 [Planococcus citri]|uniref:uncharacterized protein LOC135845282 isoform X2 n=1 Tax=Planococcus citri TaxID=170843 RepID=UPI0031F7C4DE
MMKTIHAWWLIFVNSFPTYSVNSHAITSSDTKQHNNLTQAIRTNREIAEERTWDEFPVVHDFFFESEEGYPEEGRREYSNDFQPLCQNVRRRIELKSDIYEYYPPHYVETVCRKFTPSGVGELSRNTNNQFCAQPGFRCVQRTQTLYLTRKRYDSECWENTKEVIASGCDCMWPGRY